MYSNDEYVFVPRYWVGLGTNFASIAAPPPMLAKVLQKKKKKSKK